METAEKLKETASSQYVNELKKTFSEKFGKTLSRSDLRRFVTSSGSNMSAGRLDQFLMDTFGDEESLSTELFMQKFNALRNDAFDAFVNDESRLSPGNEDVQERLIVLSQLQFCIRKASSVKKPEFKINFSELKKSDLSDHVIEEPTCSARGAFFVADRAGHRFKMTLSTASRCCINLSMDTSDVILTFFIVRNGQIEGVGQILPSHEYISAVWQGDLPAGTYNIIPCPVTLPKR